ncbi:MAG: ribonuclease III [Bacteroidota bacterium]|nr:ribonuclease III [Bacteroidota bacterium]
MILFFQSKENKQLINAINFILGYKTKKPDLFKLALLHKSIKSDESNERLEFLGDAILGLIVAKYLFKLYPFKDEGFLTKIRSKIVNRDSLNNIGRKIGLKNLINVKRIKSKSYDSIYGDALEAIIGACYLEKGFDFCEDKVVQNIIVPYFDLDNLTTQTHNFKSKVLEWAQKEKMKISFIVEKTSKSNKFSQFKSILKLNGKNISIGYGKSKKNAEKDASRLACDKLELN